jgi:hypothetical protein
MPSKASALIGFMQESEAVQWMRNTCTVKNRTDAELSAEWNAANKRLGPASVKAGRPDIRLLDQATEPYLQALVNEPWVVTALNTPNSLSGAQFAMVEVDPLLAFQFHIDTDRSNYHTAATPGLGVPPLQEMLECCLPRALTTDEARVTPQGSVQCGSAVITSRSLNLQVVQAGGLQFPGSTPPVENVFGLQVGYNLPLVYVTRFGGRCYLSNGYHRALGLRKRGAMEIPCVVRDVSSAQLVGLGPGTFEQTLMESINPPTMGHHTQGRAHDVDLKALFRTVTVAWSDVVTTYET